MKRHLRTLTKPKNEIINMKHREYNITARKMAGRELAMASGLLG
jgi:hypothetical protein